MFILVEKVGEYAGQPEACIETGANESPSVAPHCCCCCGTGSERELRTTVWVNDYASLHAEVPPTVQLDEPRFWPAPLAQIAFGIALILPRTRTCTQLAADSMLTTGWRGWWSQLEAPKPSQNDHSSTWLECLLEPIDSGILVGAQSSAFFTRSSPVQATIMESF